MNVRLQKGFGILGTFERSPSPSVKVNFDVKNAPRKFKASTSPMLISFTSRSSRGRLNSFKNERCEETESGFTSRSSPTQYNPSLFTNPTTPSFDLLGDLGFSAIKDLGSLFLFDVPVP